MIWLLFLMQAPGANCAPCHAAIVQQYAASSMARTSGQVTGETKPSEFDAWNGLHVRISADYRVSFTRGTDVAGERLLRWFLGSGRVGRSYLFEQEGGLFQAPVSYYTQGDRWAASPGFERQPTMDLARAVEPSCLQCHTTRLQTSSGIGCERCHGPAAAHLAARPAAKRGSIVNPAKLDSARRDSVCAQCHLTGAARVSRLRRAEYRPGERLSDAVSVFVWSNARTAPLTVTSHFEKLSHSACATGGQLWCVSCHDPHGEPSATQRVDFYRTKCQSCHASKKPCTATTTERDCASCHMPKGDFAGTEHAVYTDHGIPRQPGRAASAIGDRKLVPFALTPGDERDRAMAYAVAAMTEPAVRREAFDLLRAAETRDPGDLALAAQLAQFYDRLRQPEKALPLLERVVKGDATNTAAAVNLGSAYAQQGRIAEAKQLWLGALRRQPALTGARLNLAVALYREGDRAGALAAVRQALAYDPDAPAARRLLDELSR